MPFLCPVCMLECGSPEALHTHFSTHDAAGDVPSASKRRKGKAPKKGQPQAMPSTAMLIAAPVPAIEGWLTKRGRRNKRSWKTRWFEAFPGRDGVLHYYKDGSKGKRLGSISLSNATVRPSTADGDLSIFGFVIVTGKRVWELATETRGVLNGWLEVLGYASDSRADQLIVQAEEMILSAADESWNPFADPLPGLRRPSASRRLSRRNQTSIAESVGAAGTLEYEDSGKLASRLSMLDVGDFVDPVELDAVELDGTEEDADASDDSGDDAETAEPPPQPPVQLSSSPGYFLAGLVRSDSGNRSGLSSPSPVSAGGSHNDGSSQTNPFLSDWLCATCQGKNTARQNECVRCSTPRSSGATATATMMRSGSAPVPRASMPVRRQSHGTQPSLRLPANTSLPDRARSRSNVDHLGGSS